MYKGREKKKEAYPIFNIWLVKKIPSSVQSCGGGVVQVGHMLWAALVGVQQKVEGVVRIRCAPNFVNVN